MFSLFWAVQIFATKLGFIAGASVLPFQIMLILFATLTLMIVLWRKTHGALGNLFRNQPALFWKLFLANGIQSGLGTFLSIIGIALTVTINAGFLVKMATVTTILFAWLLLDEKLSLQKIGVMIFMLTGAYLLTTKGQSLLPHIGDLFILGACVSWSLGNVLVRKTLRTQTISADVVTMQKPMASLSVFGVLISVVVFFPKILGSSGLVLSCCTFSTSSFPYALLSGVFLALTWIYLYRTLSVSTASYMTLMSMMTPIIVSVLAMVFLGERFVGIQLVGAGMIVLSAAVIYLSDIAYR